MAQKQQETLREMSIPFNDPRNYSDFFQNNATVQKPEDNPLFNLMTQEQ
jgi:hypothetical protein